jgi:hypothetical protein
MAKVRNNDLGTCGECRFETLGEVMKELRRRGSEGCLAPSVLMSLGRT